MVVAVSSPVLPGPRVLPICHCWSWIPGSFARAVSNLKLFYKHRTTKDKTSGPIGQIVRNNGTTEEERRRREMSWLTSGGDLINHFHF
ncbi:hypothetical protein BO83DRAFT_57098 [Aspergillus eucalypticola CBS 122712]|uniref:Uncharacterized protein n=1 Tax=Aspergillus eucalypticola (strain CBS 122712 / IBT 29274) TaxID=1448314 RepID=A0A317V8X4_ASPEC|nr:uncharacterized protein BO83DRAFT_57098 [Aspergillus eucalypticola CBS 122712]PWY70596.1 hypothetical protein BO83DRAFT_57098 [Aspergillus eucalypticola CBS 122712]